MFYWGLGQDRVLDLSFRHYRAGASPRNWHRDRTERCFIRATQTRTSRRRQQPKFASTGSCIGTTDVSLTARRRSDPGEPTSEVTGRVYLLSDLEMKTTTIHLLSLTRVLSRASSASRGPPAVPQRCCEPRAGPRRQGGIVLTLVW